jgi:curli biogenesis system outer membrane secretion channel CsgG
MTLLPPRRFGALVLFASFVAGCSSVEGSVGIEPVTYDTSYSGPKGTLEVGSFSNSSSYLRGIFTGGPDRLGNQGRSILETHLARTNRFYLVSENSGLVITGQVMECGPGADGGAACEVRLNVVEAETSRVLYSVLGNGTHQLTDQEASAFRSTSGYDETVTSRILDQALGEAVGRLVAGLESGAWSPAADE